MKQVITSIPVQKPPVHPPPATATVAGILRPTLTTVGQYDHVAAATYLMKHTGTTALIVADAQTGQPTGIITETDITHAIADGKNANDIWVNAVMTICPAITTTTSISDAAKIMTATHLRHLPVTGDTGILGIVDVTDVYQTLTNTGQGDPSQVADPDRAARPSPSLSRLSGARPAVT